MTDDKDKLESRKILLTLVILVIAIAAGFLMMMPAIGDVMQGLNSGIDLKASAIIAFFVTLILMVALAIASGDGIFGELQFLLVGFVVFFVILWLMIAWIF